MDDKSFFEEECCQISEKARTESIAARPKMAGNNNTYALSAHRRIERRSVEVNFVLLPWNLIEG